MRPIALLVVLTVTPLTLVADPSRPAELTLSVDETAILEAANAERAKAGLVALKPNPLLFAAARSHAANMAKQDKLAHDLDGTFNVAGDGLLPWSEVAAMCGKRLAPLPPVGRGLAASLLGRLGVDLPPELLDLLTYGRGADNRLLESHGFDYRYTSAGAVRAFAEAARLRRTIGERDRYRYERDVEQFFRHSPAVVRDQPR